MRGHAATAAPAADRPTAGAIERSLLESGLENVTVSPGRGIEVAYENRRHRRSVDALALARAATGERLLAGERRLGLLAAAIFPPEPGEHGFRVAYPSDAWFPDPPQGPQRAPTFAHADLDLGALVDYRVGRIFDPMQVRAELEPRLVLNPWTGARVRFGVAIPLQTDFQTTDLNPDLDRVRPSRASLDQFAWLPGVALLSFSGGFFGDDRWGASVGAARPLLGGRCLLDLQADRTGFFATTDHGSAYSPLDRTSGFAGFTVRPPIADLAVKLRAGQFLYGDRGVDLEVRRSFDDVEVAYFAQHTDGHGFYGIRLDLPVPPMTRASGAALRIQPTARFPLTFRNDDAISGTFLEGVASREEFLRQLNPTSLDAGMDRYQRGLAEAAGTTFGNRATSASTDQDPWVSFTGMTGFVNTPWAGVVADRGLQFGYADIPRRWAYDHRGTNDNQVFYATLGFLPRVETAFRWTRIPGYHSFEEIVPDSRLVDMDRMASARLSLLTPRPGRPGVALGIEDAHGQRRFHSTYAVAGLPFAVGGALGRLAAGYGFRMFPARRRVLDGTFGAAELAPWRWIRTQLEYDSEKWNAGLGLSPWAGLRLSAALLHFESLGLGAAWSLRL